MDKCVVIGCDHRGVDLKLYVKNELERIGYTICDVGYNYDPNDKKIIDTVDYNDYAEKACTKVLELNRPAILICGSGIGMSIAANRFKNIRSAVCYDVNTVVTARQHNNINVLSLGADVVGKNKKLVTDIVTAFLQTEFIKEERYIRRNTKLDRP